MTAASLNWDRVFAWRLRRQLLEPIGDRDVPTTVRALCGVQAQVPSAADLAVAVRRDPPAPGGLARALEQRSVMRTWAMRGTLHVLAPGDAEAFLSLLGAVRTWEEPAWQRNFGAGPEEIDLLARTVAEVLDGRVLERVELIEEVAARAGHRELDAHLRSGWGALLKPLAWMGLLCNGPSRGNRVTFTSPQSWLTGWRGIPEVDTAARIAIPAYLHAYGPARPETFDAWLTRGRSRKPQLRRWFGELEEDGVIATVALEDGGSAYARAADCDELRDTPPSTVVRLVPGFDQSVLGPGTADPRVVAPARRKEVSKAAGWIAPVVLRGGRVIGVWSLEGEDLSVRLFTEEEHPGARVSAASLDAEATRLGRCLDRTVRVLVERT
jgi:hypothetical protein